VECDEIWNFCYAKQKNVPTEHQGCSAMGTWIAIDTDTKLVPSWLVGERTVDDAWALLTDLQERLANRVQLTSDGLKSTSTRLTSRLARRWTLLSFTRFTGPIRARNRPAVTVLRLARVRT
jgi:transposase-like protein